MTQKEKIDLVRILMCDELNNAWSDKIIEEALNQSDREHVFAAAKLLGFWQQVRNKFPNVELVKE